MEHGIYELTVFMTFIESEIILFPQHVIFSLHWVSFANQAILKVSIAEKKKVDTDA